MSYGSEIERCPKCGDSVYPALRWFRAIEGGHRCPLCQAIFNGSGWWHEKCGFLRLSLASEAAHRESPEHKKWVETRDRDARNIISEAQDEAHRIRKKAEEDAEETHAEAVARSVNAWDRKIHDKEQEFKEWEEKVEAAHEAYEDELFAISLRRKDRVLWSYSPEEIKAHLSDIQDLDRRIDTAIAVMLHRGFSVRVIGDALHVPSQRVQRVQAGEGVTRPVRSPIETVRFLMGPPPDGYVRPLEAASPSPSSARSSSKSLSPRDPDSVVRATALRRFGEGAGVRDVARETGKSVGWASKVFREWKNRRAGASEAP